MQTINPGTHWLSWSAGIAQLHKAAARIELWTRNNLTVCAALATTTWSSCSRLVSVELVAPAAVGEAAMLTVLGCVPSGSCRSRADTGGSGLCVFNYHERYTHTTSRLCLCLSLWLGPGPWSPMNEEGTIDLVLSSSTRVYPSHALTRSL